MAIINGDNTDNDLDGTTGNDEINGLGGNDILEALDGDDIVNGGNGFDSLYGGNGFDTIDGGSGDDAIQAGGNITVVTTTHASDIIDGGTGKDTLYIDYGGFVIVGSGAAATVSVDFTTGAGEVDVSGFRGENFTNVELLNIDCPDGNDNVTGGAFTDLINGEGGDDLLRGAGGDDLILDSWGIVDADGGGGSDLFVLNRRLDGHEDTLNSIVDGTLGTFTVGGVSMGTFKHFESLNISTGSGNDQIVGVIGGVNVLSGGAGKDTLTGQDFGDTLSGDSENDTIVGNAGADIIDGGTGNDKLHGDAGNDVIRTGGGIDNVTGDDDDDSVILDVKTANVPGAKLVGGAGTDTLDLSRGGLFNIDLTTATIKGFEILNDFHVEFFLSPYTITMTTDQFKQFDTIQMNSFSDEVTIKFADDATVVLPVTSGFRTLQLADGGQKVDLSNCVMRPFTVNGGTGDDTVIAFSNAANFFDTNLGDGNDKYVGLLSLDRANGGNGKDNLDGGAGNDTLKGDAGVDTLKGGDANDLLTGGADADKLDGGVGLDKFIYLAAADSTGKNFDTITGFDANAQDKIDVPTITVGGVDAAVSGGTLTKANFNADLELAVNDGQLAVGHAVLFTAGPGDYTGKVFLVVNLNGAAGYDANADLVIMLESGANLNLLDMTDFA